MKNRFITVMLLLVLLVTLTGNAQATSPTLSDQTALVYVELNAQDDLSRFASTHLPLYAMLDRGLLTGADRAGQASLLKAGLSLQVLDTNIRSGSYYQAETRASRPAPDYTTYGTILLKFSNGVLLRMDPSRVDALTQAGAELRLITLTPKPIPTVQSENVFPALIETDPLIQTMIDQVSQTQVYTYDRQLAGELPVYVDGDWYTITSRNTNSGLPIQKTTSFVGQHMTDDLGLGVEYYVWDDNTNPDVIGEIPGQINPDDIFIIGAHIDDVNGTPGADDNASGSVATLIAADILSQYNWGCTLRFGFWTGEEQGLLGSAAYAQHAFNSGENILGYLNLDMIAWNAIGSDPTIFLGYRSSVPGSLALANLFSDVVDAYNINLLPVIGTGYDGSSDHTSFLDYGYPAILGIEGEDDFNPYYHGPSDTPAHTDPTYFTDYVKASIATYAHMSGCVIQSGIGSLDGHVTAADGGAPIAGATVTANDGQGHDFSTDTDASGYYTRTLLANTYAVTASAYGYLPSTISGVTITTDTVTTQDFELVSSPTYVISGTVTESGTGLPLLAEISFAGSPVTVWSDPSTGFYQAELPQGNYTMQVRADLHRPQGLAIVMDHDQTQNFNLDPLPCILLVDDDQNDPDVISYYTAALDGLGAQYDIWDTSLDGDPGIQDIAGYSKLLWELGYPWSGTFNSTNETNVAAYLDGGGNFFLSGQDYLYDMGLTSFGMNYLHILNYQNDESQTSVTGQNVFSGLGPYSLGYPYTNYSDVVNPDASAQVAFIGNIGNAAISYAGDNFNSVFFAYPFEAIPQLSDREAVMGRLLDFFGACQAENGWLDGHVTDADTGDPLEGVLVSASPGKSEIQAITDPSGYYTMTLPAGDYLVTAALAGYTSQSQNAAVITDETTTIDFSLAPACTPVSGANFTWLPVDPLEGDLVLFTATANGTQPIDFTWDFGDTFTGTGATIDHTYLDAGTYPVELSATNACGTDTVIKDITILQKLLEFFLPLLHK